MDIQLAISLLSKGANRTPEEIEAQAGITEYDKDFEPYVIVDKLAKWLDVNPRVIKLLTLEEQDIQEDKKELFKEISPLLNELIVQALLLNH